MASLNVAQKFLREKLVGVRVATADGKPNVVAHLLLLSKTAHRRVSIALRPSLCKVAGSTEANDLIKSITKNFESTEELWNHVTIMYFKFNT